MSDGLTLTPEPVVERLAKDIVETYQQDLSRRVQPPTKRSAIWLSDTHDCKRFMAYSCLEGEKRRPMTTEVQAVLEAGTIWEREIIIPKLMKLGFQVQGQADTVEIKNSSGEVIARGRVDLFIRYEGEIVPCEIKALNSHTYARINEVEDLFRQPWTEKYVRQLMLYCYGKDKEWGLFIISDRAGHLKVIPLYLEYEYCEKILKALEDTWKYVKSQDLPDRIPYTPKLCDSCQFGHICLPEKVLEGGEAFDDQELAQTLARHEELKPLAKEYEEIHGEVVGRFKGKSQATVSGRFIVRPSKFTKVSYDTKALSDETRKSIAKEIEVWKVEVKEITEAKA